MKEGAEKSMSTRETGKSVALVTGGSRGIGAAIARRLASDGFDIALTHSKSGEAAEKIVAEIQKSGKEAVAFMADASSGEDMASLVPKVVDKYGRLDVLVNNAGLFGLSPLTEETLENFQKMMAINVQGPFLAAREAAKVMGEGGRIINIGSVNGMAMPFQGGSLYAATKGAVKMFTQGWARDLGPKGITVNNVQPGPIDTELNPADPDQNPNSPGLQAMTAIGRYGRADEVASLVSFLAGPDSSNITGASFNVDGGMIA